MVVLSRLYYHENTIYTQTIVRITKLVSETRGTFDFCATRSLENGSGVFFFSTVRKPTRVHLSVTSVTHLRVFLLALEVEIRGSHIKTAESTRAHARKLRLFWRF